MPIDFDIMTKVQKIVNAELYDTLCEYIEYRESAEWQKGYDEGMSQGFSEGFEAKE